MGQVYTYQIEATDAENDPLTYTLVSMPAGVSLDEQTGSITWTPVADQIGLHTVSVRVADDRGDEATQKWTVGVSAPGNGLPEITSQPTTWALTEEDYHYDVEAGDPDGDTLTFALVAAPAGMTIDPASGVIQWPAQTGFYDIRVQATDGRGGLAVQAYTLEVAAELIPLKVGLSISPQFIEPGETTTVTVSRKGGRPPVTLSLAVDGEPLSLDAQGRATITGQTPGIYNVQAIAQDSDGSDTVTDLFVVRDVNDITPPVVSLDDTDCIDVTDLHAVTGSISDDGGFFYRLQYRRQNQSTWKLLTRDSGSGGFTGQLGVFDPTLLQNGIYEIRLIVQDLNGNINAAMGCALVDGKLKLGALELPAVDAVYPQMGPDLVIERQYDSRELDSGDFGPGWHLPSSTIKPMVTGSLAEGWDQEARGGFFTTYYLMELQRHLVVLRLSDEEVLKFRMDVNPKSSTLYPFGTHVPQTVSYQPVEDTQGSLISLDAAASVMLIGNQLLSYGTDPYEPTRFRYTAPDGTVYVISMAKGLESVTDSYGHSVTYADDGIRHSSGAAITFERGTDNRIETITDMFGGTITYYYSEEGTLERVVQGGSQHPALRTLNNMAYAQGVAERPVLKSIMAPDGTELGQFEYDSQGRVTALTDADGNRVIYGYDLPNHRQEITDRNGHVSVYEYDDQGNVTQKTDPLGHITQWTFDDNGNMLSKTDALDNTTFYEYDANGNVTMELDPEGNLTEYTYNARNQVLTQTDANGNLTQYTYDDNGNLLTTVDAAGNTTTNTYDTDGNLASTTDALDNVTAYGYDANGNKILETDPLGHETTYTFDAYGNELTQTVSRTNAAGETVVMTISKAYDNRGNLIRQTDPDGAVTSYEYNTENLKTAQIDPLGNRTEFEYDGNGNQTAVYFPDGTSQITVYDGEGNRLSLTDRSGNTTTFDYDPLNHPLETVYADGGVDHMEYDVIGQLIASIDENGNRTEYEYDGSGRRISVRDALGQETLFEYDGNANPSAVIDPLSHVTTYEYDNANNLVRTTFADGTSVSVQYDGKGNKIAGTDANGRTTQFEYDPVGRLTAVIDGLSGETSYTYDEVGNKLSQTDPNGHTKTWTYNDTGQVTTHTLAGGQTESFAYDVQGNMLSHTDFNGNTTVYTYSVCCGRLLSKTFADGGSVIYTYTGTGKKHSVTDDRGTTLYIYDPRDRLVSETQPDGTTISYTYDTAGNRTSVTVPSGSTMYTFDALNRLLTVTGPAGGVTTYGYDAVGNRLSVAYPNGNITTHLYDELNRLTRMENQNGAGEIISSYAYVLGTAGNRHRVTENSGRTVDYSYDALYRLVQEEINDPVVGNETISYTYDAFGNRLTKTDSNGTTTYIYDENDRLLNESGTTSSFTYSYDASGNTIAKTDGATTINYGYDTENRLIRINDATSVTVYTYDADGIRMAKSTNGEVNRFVVDKNRQYAQVLEERNGTGSLTVSYVYGDDLISQHRDGALSYYLYDGQLSTRALTDAFGEVNDQYTYDAFGILLDRNGDTENNYLYTGEQFDPNAGFYYLRARYYDQLIGRFVGRDTWKGNNYDPLSLNLYIYTQDNPINYIDPTGKFSIISYSVTNAISSNLRKSNDAKKAFRAYKNVRRGLCTAAALTATNAHHAIPMFMGGRSTPGPSGFVRLPKNFHIEFHRLLHYMLRMADFPGGMGPGASKKAYRKLFKSNPATRTAAHQVLILAAKVFDNACTKQGARPITPTIRAQIKAGKWDF